MGTCLSLGISKKFAVLTWKLEVLRLLQEKLQVLEVVRQDWPAGPHEIEDVPEHSAIPVNEVVLLEGVEHDGDPAAEHPRQA